MKSAPSLRDHHKVARLEFARKNMSTNWNAVSYLNQLTNLLVCLLAELSVLYLSLRLLLVMRKKFNLDGPDGFNGYWRDLRKEPKYFSKRNFGGGSLRVWGAFCSRGTLTLAFPSTHMDSAEYQQVLHNNLIPFLSRFRRKHFIFQQDNAQIHTSASTMSWFSEKSVKVLEWPGCSLDCNPMENLWGIMVRSVYENNRQYNSLQELKSWMLGKPLQNSSTACQEFLKLSIIMVV